jgi:hypothetical protein
MNVMALATDAVFRNAVVELQLPECVGADRPIFDRHVDGATGPVVGDGERVGHRTSPPP